MSSNGVDKVCLLKRIKRYKIENLNKQGMKDKYV